MFHPPPYVAPDLKRPVPSDDSERPSKRPALAPAPAETSLNPRNVPIQPRPSPNGLTSPTPPLPTAASPTAPPGRKRGRPPKVSVGKKETYTRPILPNPVQTSHGAPPRPQIATLPVNSEKAAVSLAPSSSKGEGTAAEPQPVRRRGRPPMAGKKVAVSKTRGRQGDSSSNSLGQHAELPPTIGFRTVSPPKPIDKPASAPPAPSAGPSDVPNPATKVEPPSPPRAPATPTTLPPSSPRGLSARHDVPTTMIDRPSTISQPTIINRA